MTAQQKLAQLDHAIECTLDDIRHLETTLASKRAKLRSLETKLSDPDLAEAKKH